MQRRTKTIILFIAAAFLLSACTISFESSGSGNTRTNGGVFKSTTSGETWKQTTGIATVGNKTLTFSHEDTIALAIDPQDNEGIYTGTESGGLLFSFDAGATWYVARNLGQVKVQAIAISPKDKCVIFAASNNKIFKSTDCNRTWDEMYFDNSKAVLISSLDFHPVNDSIIYAGTSRGEVITSYNAGKSWTVLKRFDDAKKSADNMVVKVAVNKKTPNILWAATSGSGVYRSTDGGRSWRGFVEEFAEINNRNANDTHDIALSQESGRIVIAATNAGLIRSFDNGDSWQLMDIIPPSEKTTINDVEIFPGDDKRIYYATDTSFAWSEDGGTTWSSKKLPTTRRGVELAIDNANPYIIYLGVKAVEKN